MKAELEQISESVKQCYHITEKTHFEIETVDAYSLLTTNRLDLGAKLYYIQCFVEGKECMLAEALYRKHIEVMGYAAQGAKQVEEQVEQSLDNFRYLIERFQAGEEEAPVVVVGNQNEIIDGAHVAACSIYFGKKVQLLCCHEIEGEIFDFKFFLENGLEQGYMELMACCFAFYRKDCVGRYSIGESNRYRKMSDLQKAIEEAGCYMVYGKRIETDLDKGWYYIFYSNRRKKLTKELCEKHYEDIKEALELDNKEKNQSIVISKEEEIQCKKARDMQYRYTKCLTIIRKALHLPVKKNESGYGCLQPKKKI